MFVSPTPTPTARGPAMEVRPVPQISGRATAPASQSLRHAEAGIQMALNRLPAARQQEERAQVDNISAIIIVYPLALRAMDTPTILRELPHHQAVQ